MNLVGTSRSTQTGDPLGTRVLHYQEAFIRGNPSRTNDEWRLFVYLDKFPEELKMINDIDFSQTFEAEHDLNREGGRLYQLVVKAVARSLELSIDCSIIACGMRSNFNKDYLSHFWR